MCVSVLASALCQTYDGSASTSGVRMVLISPAIDTDSRRPEAALLF